MARIPRNTAVIFGGTAGAVPGGIGVFGSLAAGTPTESINLAVIQAAAQWSEGWGSAFINLFPAQEDMNAVGFVLSQQIAEILQDGIPPYDSGTIYFLNSFCGSGGFVYVSLVDNNLGNDPSTSTSQWAIYGSNIFNELVATSVAVDQNNYNPAGWGSNIYDLIITNTAGANINLTGLKFLTNGQLINIINNGTGSSTITIQHQNAGSTSANRFIVNGGDLILPGRNIPGAVLSCAQFYYSKNFGAWILLSKNF